MGCSSMSMAKITYGFDPVSLGVINTIVLHEQVKHVGTVLAVLCASIEAATHGRSNSQAYDAEAFGVVLDVELRDGANAVWAVLARATEAGRALRARALRRSLVRHRMCLRTWRA